MLATRRVTLPSHGSVRPSAAVGTLRAKKPGLGEAQQQGRAIWWDKSPQDLALRREMDAGRVPQPAYVYQTE